MKTSNKILSGLILVLVISIISVDFTLKNAYLKVNLNDRFKNYQQVAIKPFKYLKIKGGNTYAIVIQQADSLDLKVMTSRQSFLTTTYHGDTLLIQFNIATTTQSNAPESLPQGIILSSPAIAAIYADGTSNVVENWKADTLSLALNGNATAGIQHTDVNTLNITGNYNSILSFQSDNTVRNLNLNIKDNASVYLNAVTYTNLNPEMQNNARLIFNAASAQRLKMLK